MLRIALAFFHLALSRRGYRSLRCRCLVLCTHISLRNNDRGLAFIFSTVCCSGMNPVRQRGAKQHSSQGCSSEANVCFLSCCFLLPQRRRHQARTAKGVILFLHVRRPIFLPVSPRQQTRAVGPSLLSPSSFCSSPPINGSLLLLTLVTGADVNSSFTLGHSLSCFLVMVWSRKFAGTRVRAG